MVGVDVLVSVLRRISVGVGVYVCVGGRVVGDGCVVGFDSVGIAEGVSVGREVDTEGGMSIAARSRAVTHKPVEKPRNRYFISARMAGGVFGISR